jgi:hypothetical protein
MVHNSPTNLLLSLSHHLYLSLHNKLCSSVTTCLLRGADLNTTWRVCKLLQGPYLHYLLIKIIHLFKWVEHNRSDGIKHAQGTQKSCIIRTDAYQALERKQ